MLIGTQWIQRVGSTKCETCSRPVGYFVEVVPIGQKENCGHTFHNGRMVQWYSRPFCPTCIALNEYRSAFPQSETDPQRRTRTAVRGERREVIEGVRDDFKAKGRPADLLTADIVESALASFTGPRITTDQIRSVPMAGMIDNVIQALPGDQGPAGALFPVGSIEIRQEPYIRNEVIFNLIDRHASGDHGELGPLPVQVSVGSAFCPPFAPPIDVNRQTIDAGHGPVRSTYLDFSGPHPGTIEILTLVRQSPWTIAWYKTSNSSR